MARVFGYHLSIEMSLLWLLESTMSFVVLCAVFGGSPDVATVPPGSHVVDGAVLVALTVGLVAFALGLYQSNAFAQTRRLVLKSAVAAVVSLPAVWLAGTAAQINFGNLFGHEPTWPLRLLAAWMGLLLGTRLLFSAAVRHNLVVRPILIIGSAEEIARNEEAIGTAGRGLFQIKSLLPVDGAASDVAGLARTLTERDSSRRLWGVVVGPTAAELVARANIPTRRRQAVRIFSEGEFWERYLGRSDAPMADCASERAGRSVRAVVSRALDLFLTLMLLLVTLPLMLVTALLIKLESDGPVLYWQERVGLGGRSFALCKFRSMRVDAEQQGPVWAAARDARVTRIGRFIRRVRIDELPQLFNILRGDMSLIGPRPERPHFVAQLDALIPGYRARAQVKPGLTGWAQVNYPYGASVEDARAKLSFDLYYVKHRGLLLDLLILFSTVRVVLFQEGAR